MTIVSRQPEPQLDTPNAGCLQADGASNMRRRPKTGRANNPNPRRTRLIEGPCNHSRHADLGRRVAFRRAVLKSHSRIHGTSLSSPSQPTHGSFQRVSAETFRGLVRQHTHERASTASLEAGFCGAMALRTSGFSAEYPSQVWTSIH
jgi:hypothetical protein